MLYLAMLLSKAKKCFGFVFVNVGGRERDDPATRKQKQTKKETNGNVLTFVFVII
jgi:hypothetical protein